MTISNIFKIPRNRKALDQFYLTGKSPHPNELEGTYTVQMLTGIIPDFSWLGHTKNFRHTANGVEGENRFGAGFKWGKFCVQEQNWPNGMQTVIDYAQPSNLFSRGIRDTLVIVEPGRAYLGKFHYIFGGRPRFFGYFSLIKQE